MAQTPPVQRSGPQGPVGQVPQSSKLPQPSPTVPHSRPWSAQLLGQHGAPQTLGTPSPPQTAHVATSQTPQVSVLPQPSDAVPQSRPCSAQVLGRHPLLLAELVDVVELVAVEAAAPPAELLPEALLAPPAPPTPPLSPLTTFCPHPATRATRTNPARP